MLTTWGRVSTLTAGLGALKPLPAYRAVIPASQFLSRGLATATAPKKATAATTKKAAAATATKGKAPAKKTATTAATKKAPAKKVAAKPAAKKTAEKNVEPKKPGRKPKTDEEKLRDNIKSLLAKALDPPIALHRNTSPWLAFLKDKYAAVKGTGQSVTALLSKSGEAWSTEYKSLSPAQMENLKAKAESTKGSNQQALTDWVNEHTPAEIHQANIARAALRSLKAKHDPPPRGIKGKSFTPIPDDRYPLRPRSPNILYIKDKLALLPKDKKFESLPVIMREYIALPEADKQKWKDLAAQDLKRYYGELKAVGIDPSAAA